MFQNLPPLLKSITDQFSDQRERDMVLTSSLVVLGGCFANIKGKYRHDWVNPNLFAFIVAPPASGKGIIKYTQNLGKSIQDEYTNANIEARKKFKAALRKFEWDQKKHPAKHRGASKTKISCLIYTRKF